MEVQVGDFMQIWLDHSGYQGRVGEVVKQDKRYLHLQLGGGELVKLQMQSKVAKIPGSSKAWPLRFKVTPRPGRKIKIIRKRTRFKRTRTV